MQGLAVERWSPAGFSRTRGFLPRRRTHEVEALPAIPYLVRSEIHNLPGGELVKLGVDGRGALIAIVNIDHPYQPREVIQPKEVARQIPRVYRVSTESILESLAGHVGSEREDPEASYMTREPLPDGRCAV